MKYRVLYAMAVVAMGALTTHNFASTIADVTTSGAGVYTLPGELVVDVLNVSATANTFTLADSTGGIIVYSFPKTTYTATVGDIIDITATNDPYQGAAELTSTSASVAIDSQGNPVPAPIVVTASQLAAGVANGLPLAEELVTLEGVSFPAGTTTLGTNTTYAITDASGSANVYTYKSDSQVLAADTAASAAGILPGPVDITGYVDEYDPSGTATFELYPTSITAAAAPEPASLGLLGLGAIAMLSRRRRNA